MAPVVHVDDDDRRDATDVTAKWLIGRESIEDLAPGLTLASCRKCGAALKFRISDFDEQESGLRAHVAWHLKYFPE